MKQILLTGASSGIGEATARYLSECGYRLFLVARSEEKLKALCRELGEGHAYCVCDLSDYNHVNVIFEKAQEEGFVFDGVVYSAGVGFMERIRSIDLGNVSYAMNTNCFGFVAMARQLCKRKVMNDGGSIVALSSLSTETELPGSAAYSMSKAALNSVCSTLSKEMLKRRIRVNTVMPAMVHTPMNALNEGAEQLQPWGWIEPQDVAMLIEFLLSDKSRMITGANIPISAGMQY